ncbi:MAG: AI-2E family transporter, partial [Actinomycetota bacterium]|nr:AI-2E family transporter [Actinomycetota bacterium]
VENCVPAAPRGHTDDMSTPAPPRLPAGERLRRVGVGAWSIIGILILLAISVWLLLKISVIFPPLVLALLIIYLLNPIVTRLEERRVPRWLAAVLAYVVVLGSLTLLIIAVTPLISRQVSNFAEEWPHFRVEIVRTIQDTTASIDDRFGTNIDTTQIECLLGADDIEGETSPTHQRCDEVTRDFRERLGEQAGRITEVGGTILEILLIFVVGPLVALYLLIDLPQLQRDVLNLVPEPQREEFRDLGSKMGRAVGGFFRGQLFVALFVGILASIGFLLIGLPFWLVIGAIAGFTNLIPLVGPFIGGAIGFVVGTISEGFGLGLWAVAVALVVQQVDNHFISPHVMKRTVQLHPASVMLALLAGGTIAGFWGVLLAVPGLAVAKIILSHIWSTRVLGVDPTPLSEAARAGVEPPSVVPRPSDEPPPSEA